METSVLIQVPYELESAYSPLEERTDIDYTVMSVDNFNVGDFLIGLYITISSNSIITGVVSGMIWDVIKIVSHDVLDKLRQFEMFRLFDVYSELKGKEIVYQDHPTPKERQDNIFSMFKDDIPEEMNRSEGLISIWS